MILYDRIDEIRESRIFGTSGTTSIRGKDYHFVCEKYHVDANYDLEIWLIDDVFVAYRITAAPGVDPVVPPSPEVNDLFTRLKQQYGSK